jgi:addiction module HigA family antidote
VEITDYHLAEGRCDVGILNTMRREVRPTHPGEMLRKDLLPEYGLSVAELAKAIGVSRQTVNELLRERRGVSPEMALRLSRLFGNTPEFWLKAQMKVDLWETSRALEESVKRIRPLHTV